MIRGFLWERDDWPELRFDPARLSRLLVAVAGTEGRVAGALAALATGERDALAREALVSTALDTSEIEGERIRPESIRASLTRRLALRRADGSDPAADGVVSLSVDAIRNAAAPLTRERLFAWHRELLASAPRGIAVGAWRPNSDDPMQVVSGPPGARIIHFEAPPAARVGSEMNAYVAWIESTAAAALPPVALAAIAHFRFLTIHPFADGNGRIGRAIADLVLTRAQPDAAQYVSLSRQILTERPAYYETLERTQRGDVNVTAWVEWFAQCYERAAEHTLAAIEELTRASRFWRDHAGVELNARQRKVLERYLSGSFDGWINTTKYAALAKTSADTALRDIADLVAKNILAANDGRARKTSYRLR
jgi:Fic family protein